jgi:hypothetical protein
MISGELTKKEVAIIHQLLLQKGIDQYEIFVPVGEGRDLPGSTYDCEVESLSGTVVTSTDVYGFWLDWINEHYTLGDEKECWFKVDISKFHGPEDIISIQHQLQQKVRKVKKDLV